MGLADALGMTGQAGQPPDIDPELLKQLMGLGSVDQRYKLLQDQAGRGAQLAGGVPIDYRHGQGTPQLLASLANLISSGVGGYQEGKAVAGQRSLVDEIGNTRGAFGKAVAGAGNNAGLLEQLQRAGTLSGDPVISGYSKAAPEVELKQQEIAAGRRSAEAATSPATGLARRVLLKRFNVDAPEGTPNSVLAEMVGPAEKFAGIKESANARREAAKAAAEYRERALQERQDAQAEKRWTNFGDALDPTKARGGEMAKVQNSLTQYGKVRQLIEQNPNPSSNQMYEIARTFDRAVSGGVPTEGGTEHLIPKTALGSVADFEQWLVNSPVGRNQQAFVQQIADSVNREEKYANGKLREWQGKKASRYSDLARKDQGRFESELMNWDLQPEEFDPKSWTYKGQPAAPAPPAGTSDLRKKYGL